MSFPIAPIHDPVAHPAAGSDLSADEVTALEEEIRALARERDAVILAHNYQLPEVQRVADDVGDSLQLAITGKQVPQSTILFCGVHFMAESASVLAPEKRVLLPNLSAGCSLADSITAESLEDWKARYPGHAVVTYVNSTAEVKALSDICCTSANAASVVRSLPQKKILFTPDKNLGNWVKGEGAGEGDRGLRRLLPDPRRAALLQRDAGEGDAARGGGHRPPGVPRRRARAGRRGLLHHRPCWRQWDATPGPAPSSWPPSTGCCTSCGSATRTASSSWPTAASGAACTART